MAQADLYSRFHNFRGKKPKNYERFFFSFGISTHLILSPLTKDILLYCC